MLREVVSACGTVPGLDCSPFGCHVFMILFVEHMVFLGEVLWRVLRIANWMRLVCCSSTLLCSFSFVCKDAVMGPDHDPALVLSLYDRAIPRLWTPSVLHGLCHSWSVTEGT